MIALIIVRFLGRGFIPFLEVLGYMAAGAVLATFWMRKMIPLSIIAILGNLLFLSYGLFNELHSVYLLHASLLPLNSFRLYQAVELRRKIQEISATEFKVKSLLPFMDEYKVPQGKFLFHEGDHADFIYYLSSGRICLVELNKVIEPGSLVCEIGIFTPSRQRTQSILCEEDPVFLRISEDKVQQSISIILCLAFI